MTERALGAGSTTRRRVLFGLLDAEGWSWASVKAAFWFVVIILLLGYIPDRAYYFTVFSTIDLGINVVSPVNFCAPENGSLPCPAPVGAIVPWQAAPRELELPAGRTDGALVQAGTRYLYIGGSDGAAAAATVYVAEFTGAGTFSQWAAGPALPEPRARASAVLLNGSIYVTGGLDGSGKASTTTFVLTPDAKGALPAWQTTTDAKASLDLPEARAGAMLVAASDGLILLGGDNDAGQPTATVWKATLDAKGVLGAWAPNVSMPRPRSDGTAVLNGSHLFVYGGREGADPTDVVMRGAISTAKETLGQVSGWFTGGGGANLPAARSDGAGFAANGVLYLVGGTDGHAAARQVYWAVPDSSGNIANWAHLNESDLPSGLEGARAVVGGSDVFLVGGRSPDGVAAGAARANLAPQAPFFQLGLVGATVPALKIDGEVGQQLGYLLAAGAFMGNFVLLLLAGWAFAHKEKVAQIRARLRARREGH